MNGHTSGLVLSGLDDLVEGVATRVAELLAEQSAPEPAGWLNVTSAASYLDTSEDAVRAGVRRKQIPSRKTPQGRVLFRRDELDAYVKGET
jgi:excisionase family DNA binding protein